MKPKYRNITRILPAAVTIALSLPSATQADIFDVGDAGNGTPSVLNSGANTIRADGGILPLNPNPFINIIAGVSMTGDIVVPETEVLEITAANYTVTNAGSLAGSAHDGINSTFAFTLTNSGTISAAGGNSGIDTVGGTSITNNSGGTISGTDDAITFSTGGGTVINSGLIDGITGALSDGIEVFGGITITNNDGGTIRGLDNGIELSGTLNLTNNYNATITGVNSHAVYAQANATINNYGSISGGLDGILVTSGAIINNKFTSLIGPDAGGSIIGLGGNGVTATTDLTLTNEALGLIRGSTNGIVATDGGTITTNVTNSGTITGLAGDGVQAQDSFVVINNSGGVITGTGAGSTGVWLDDNASVTNSGSITGVESGVRVSEGSTVINSGTISGGIGIDAFGSGSTFNLTNSGIITGTGGTAIDGILGGGVDTYLFNAGSSVTGDIFLRSGDDSITMTSSGLASSIVLGNIDGGSGTDTLNFVNGMTTPGGFTNRVTGNVSFMEDINKTGSGTAFVLGNVNSDTIDVTGGALYIVGSVDGTNSSQSAISANAAGIGGTGTWDANISLTNGATISPGQINLPVASTVANSIGTLTVTGDVTLSSSSAYVWNVTPGGASDRINLTGVGNVFTTNNSDFVISPTNVNTPLLNGNTIVVDTQDTLVGNFDSITVASFPSTTPDYGPFYANQNDPIIAGYFSTLNKVNGSQDWQLTIDHDYSQFGSTDNEVAAGEMLNDLVGTANIDVADLLAAMDYSDESYTEAVLAALDPGAYMAALAGVANNNYHLHRTVENHNAAVRAGSGAAVMAPAADPSAKGATVAAPVASGCSGTSNVWGSFSYDWQDLETSNSSFDQDGEVYAFTAGIDFTVAENFRLGLVAEGSQSDWDGDLNLGSEVESYRFAAYANWGAATGWFVDALVGYNTHSVDQSRGTFFGNESASYDADGWQGLVNVGYAVATSAGTFSPYLGLEWQQLSADSFDNDDSLLPISVGDYDIDSFRALAGVRWEAELAANITGYASATYAFEFEDDASDATVEFGGGSYRASGLEQGDSVLVSAGIRWGVATCTTIDMGYRGEFAMDDGVDSNGANIGLNYSF